MTKKKEELTFKEFCAEQEAKKAEAERRIEENNKKEEQIDHQMERTLNGLSDLRKRKDKARTSRLIHKGVEIERAYKASAYLTDEEFKLLAPRLFADEQLCREIDEMTKGRKEATDQEKAELDELTKMYKKALKNG